MNIQITNTQPRLIASFYSGSKDLQKEVSDALAWCDTEIVEQVAFAVKENTIALLPDWFQWARVQDNKNIFVLYTTK